MSTPDFESIKKANEYGEPYWSARDLQPLLGYTKWQKFEEVIERAIASCKTNKDQPENHFTGAGKMVSIGSGAQREKKDWNLSKYGCWLIAMNGDVRKPEIAAAQAYFLTNTHENEMHKLRQQQELRLQLRQKIAEGNTSLFQAAAQAGVNSPNFGIFEDAGIMGQYTMTTHELEEKRQIEKGDLYNTMPPHEQAGNLLRITQTDYNLRNNGITGEEAAMDEHYLNGRMVREAMIRMSDGEKPEDIKPVPSIRKLVEQRRRQVRKVKEAKKTLREEDQGTLF